MYHIKRLTLALLALAMSSVAFAQETTYVYEGNPFDDFIANPSVFDGASVDGFFTLDAPIAANFDGPVFPTNWSFTSGPVSLSPGAGIGALFEVETDGDGNIIRWLVSIAGDFPGPVQVGDTRPAISTALGDVSGQDDGELVECLVIINGNCTGTDQQDAGRIVGTPGTWTVRGGTPPVVPPAPATPIPTLGLGVWLLVVLLAGFGLVYVRRV